MCFEIIIQVNIYDLTISYANTKVKARTDVRERKRKELEGCARCDAMLAYRAKAFKKTKEHAAQNHDSLRKGLTA